MGVGALHYIIERLPKRKNLKKFSQPAQKPGTEVQTDLKMNTLQNELNHLGDKIAIQIVD